MAARYLGAGMASIINFYNPAAHRAGRRSDRGGRSLLRAGGATRAAGGAASGAGVEIVRAALGDNAGIVGAAVLAGNSQRAEGSKQ